MDYEVTRNKREVGRLSYDEDADRAGREAFNLDRIKDRNAHADLTRLIAESGVISLVGRFEGSDSPNATRQKGEAGWFSLFAFNLRERGYGLKPIPS
jgi:hypothetical protein